MIELNTIICGNALDILRDWPEEYFDACVTSPPYWGLRSYPGTEVVWDAAEGCEHVWEIMKGTRNIGRDDGYYGGDVYKGSWDVEKKHPLDTNFCSLCGAWRGSLGLEPDFRDYLRHLMQIMEQVKRVLKPTGSAWINISDTYASSNMNPNQSLSTSRALSCGSGDTAQSGSQKSGRVCYHYGGELQDGCRNHRNCIFHNERQHQRCILHSCLTSRDNGHWDSVSSFLAAFSLCVQESTTPSSVERVQVASSPKGKVLASLFEARSFFHDDTPSSCRDSYICDTFGMLLPLDCHIRDNLLSFLAYNPPVGLTSYNITNASLKVKPKSLCQIPSRFALAMTDAGWILRNHIIWYKRNCMPSSVKDRFTTDFESVFFFVKQPRYFFQQQREPHATSSLQRAKNPDNPRRRSSGTIQENRVSSLEWKPEKVILNPDGRAKRCVWDIPTKPSSEPHFAMFPDTLVEPMLRAGCPIGGIVLDPFSGMGTVGLVAARLGMDFIGIELSEEYAEKSERRLK